jgi:hypothetical protein
MEKKPKKKPLSIKIDPRLKGALENAAKKENRPLANLVDTILQNYFTDQGIDWKKETPG